MAADARQVRRFTRDLALVKAKASPLIRAIVTKTCADTKATAKALAPVDTGMLRSSIGYETRVLASSVVGEVGPTVDYGLFQEVGTTKMAPQPFMRPAFQRHEPTFLQALEQALIGEVQ